MTQPGMTIGMLVAFQMFASRLSQPLLRFVGLWQEFQQAAIAVKRLGDVMDVPAEPYALTPAREQRRDGRHRFAAWPSGTRTTDRGCFAASTSTSRPANSSRSSAPRAPARARWRSCCSASTSRSKAASASTVTTRGISPPTNCAPAFGVVPQETVLFAGTLYDNLSLADPQATFDDVIEACRRAEIHDFIESLPEGYRTLVGEHGAGLSGGQKQRIAIARALLKRPKVLVFDEATSNLDAPTARQFADTLSKLRGTRHRALHHASVARRSRTRPVRAIGSGIRRMPKEATR